MAAFDGASIQPHFDQFAVAFILGTSELSRA